MSQSNSMYYNILYKKNNKLVHQNIASEVKYKMFVNNLKDGEVVHLYMESDVPDVTLPQLARVHASIRELAKSTGDSFTDMKIKIKHKSGLVHKKVIDDNTYLITKSFAKCSKEELNLAIETCIELGDFVGMNLR